MGAKFEVGEVHVVVNYNNSYLGYPKEITDIFATKDMDIYVVDTFTLNVERGKYYDFLKSGLCIHGFDDDAGSYYLESDTHFSMLFSTNKIHSKDLICAFQGGTISLYFVNAFVRILFDYGSVAVVDKNYVRHDLFRHPMFDTYAGGIEYMFRVGDLLVLRCMKHNPVRWSTGYDITFTLVFDFDGTFKGYAVGYKIGDIILNSDLITGTAIKTLMLPY